MISVCIITRDESDMLRRCLEALRRYDVEIVVVDTGSKDDSRKTALEYTSNVYDFEWCDDFPRREIMQQVKQKMILYLHLTQMKL